MVEANNPLRSQRVSAFAYTEARRRWNFRTVWNDVVVWFINSLNVHECMHEYGQISAEWMKKVRNDLIAVLMKLLICSGQT